MAYKAINCPSCGAAITSIPDRGSFFCQYCGAKIEKDKQFIEFSGNVTVAGMASVASLLERGNMFLEDGEFRSAKNYFERVLDADPKCSKAYLGKMLADNSSRNTDSFCITYYHKIENNENYKKALRFANDEEYDKLMALKQKNLECHNIRLQRKQKDLRDAEAILASFNQYYPQHKYTEKMHKAERNALIAVTVIYSIFFGACLLSAIAVPELLLFAALVGILIWPLTKWNKRIKSKKALGDQLEKDKERLNEDVKTAKADLDRLIRNWNY